MLSNASETLVLIPAREGSKRLPGKNLRLIRGKPLIAWTIEAARASAGRSVVVSTDSAEIARVAESFGADVPFMRPAELASDTASSVDVALHAIETLGGAAKFPILMLLQPTSPLRRSDDIVAAMNLFHSATADALVSVTPILPSDFFVTVDSANCLSPLPCSNPITKLNGAIYVIRTEVLKAERTFLPPRTIAFPMSAERSVDIDHEEDWALAERLL